MAKRAERVCGDCLHFAACQSWNVGSLLNAEAWRCANFAPESMLWERGDGDGEKEEADAVDT